MLKYINEGTNTQEEYGYACGRVRVMEKSLLNRDIVEKLIEAPDLEAVFKILAESDFEEYMFDKTEPTAIDEALVNILKDTIHKIDEIAPYPYLFQIFSWKYDFHNLKVLLKTKVLSKKEPSPVYDFGNLELDYLKAAIMEGKYQLVPIKVERIIKQSEEEFMKSENIQLMEILLDKGYYEILFDELEKINHPYLFYFYKTEIDLMNILIACRCKVRHVSKSKLAEVLIKYGNLSPQKFSGIYENSVQSWPRHFQKTDYASIVENGIKYWQEEKSLTEIERLTDNFLLSLVKIGKYTSFGLESVIAYYYAKENDLKNMRVILNGKRYLLPKALIRKRIRETYV